MRSSGTGMPARSIREPDVKDLSQLTEWYLTGCAHGSGAPWRTNLHPLPFAIGRHKRVHLRLSSEAVSQRHAEVYLEGDKLWLRDLESTNGTFINGEKIQGCAPLQDGDIVHFADLQFRVEATQRPRLKLETMRLSSTGEVLPPREVRDTRDFVELLRAGAVRVEFQPVVRLADGAVVGYEALGRGALADLPTSPDALFEIGERLGMAAELSVLLRSKGLEEAARLPADPVAGQPSLFVNTHPAEMDDWQTLLDSLHSFRRREADLPVVLEIHESSVTDLATFQTLRQRLDDLNVGQAFDDFGTGEARLQELCEVSPDYVKFDLQFARDLHKASKKRREMVRALVRMMVDMKIATIAEGVEAPEEVAACRDLGFEYAQGYFFGRPASLEKL